MIPVNMILSLDQGPRWQARWDDRRDPEAAPVSEPARDRRWPRALVVLSRLVGALRRARSV